MRVSEYYKLNRTQPSLDFVDVDIAGDTRVFIDPRSLRLMRSEWGLGCVSSIQNYFDRLILAICENRDKHAKEMLTALREPNETHLGLSRGRARGKALGPESATKIWGALKKSTAVKTGLLQDLEDTILLIDGISSDRISDIVTNILRPNLIRYTAEMCRMYNIPHLSKTRNS